MQVDDLGALIAVVTANAGNIEGKRSALGLLNRLGDWLLTLAHRARANTVSTGRAHSVWHYATVSHQVPSPCNMPPSKHSQVVALNYCRGSTVDACSASCSCNA